MNKISLAIPTYCRLQMVQESFKEVLDDPRITEIVISDDASKDGSHEQLSVIFAGHDKVKLYQNPKNLDCYRNKKRAVELCTNEWVVLLDDDNILKPDYIDTLFALDAWEEKTIYAPDWAMPHFNYTAFAGQKVNRSNLSQFLKLPHFKTALNTANYFFPRDFYLEVWDGSVDPVTSDSLFQAYNWIAKGGTFFVVPNLRYFHRVHEGSHYKMNCKRTGNFAGELERKLHAL